LFPDFTRAECDVYWAISPRDVSDVVTEGEPIVQRKDIPYWTVNIGDAVVTSYELDENLEMADSTFNLMLADGTDEQVTATGYKLKSILEYLEIDVDEIQTITIVYTNGFERELTPFLMGEEQSLLVVKKEEGYLAAPMFGTLMILPDAGVAEIRVE
jgi:hypothetical protein